MKGNNMLVKCNECGDEFTPTDNQIEVAEYDNIYICSGCVEEFLSVEETLKTYVNSFNPIKLSKNGIIDLEMIPTDGTIN